MVERLRQDTESVTTNKASQPNRILWYTAATDLPGEEYELTKVYAQGVSVTFSSNDFHSIHAQRLLLWHCHHLHRRGNKTIKLNNRIRKKIA